MISLVLITGLAQRIWRVLKNLIVGKTKTEEVLLVWEECGPRSGQGSQRSHYLAQPDLLPPEMASTPKQSRTWEWAEITAFVVWIFCR